MRYLHAIVEAANEILTVRRETEQADGGVLFFVVADLDRQVRAAKRVASAIDRFDIIERWLRRVVGQYIIELNTVRLHSPIGYVTPQAMLDWRQAEIHAERDREFQAAREEPRRRRQLNQEAQVA